MSQHTPGPWYVYTGEDRDAIAIQKFVPGDNAGTTGKAIARLPIPKSDGPVSARLTRAEINANGTLIAAAPDLLASLQRLSELADAIWVKMSDAESALMVAAWKDADAAIAKATGAA